MVRFAKDQIITSIDIGTTKICVLIGRKIADHIEIIGVGKSVSHGLHKGVVVDVAKTISSISCAVKEAEIMAGFLIDSACIGISGAHIKSVSSNGVIPLKNDYITPADIVTILEAARAISIDQGDQILHVLPQYYIVNGQHIVIDPLGMHAVRLEVQAHIIIGSVSSVQNLVYCCQGAGINVTDIILEQLASAAAVLSEDELELGVGVLDIGGGTSDFAVYKNLTIRHTKVFPVAGNHVTSDIAIVLRIMKDEAERIKKLYGSVLPSSFEEQQFIEVEMMHGTDLQIIDTSDLIRIIEFRMKELFNLINNEIVEHKLQRFMSNGLVLTGGGSLIKNIQLLAENIFLCPVRLGKPRVLFDLLETLQSPLFSTGYGLLVYMIRNQQKISLYKRQESMVKCVFDRMKSWVIDFF